MSGETLKHVHADTFGVKDIHHLELYVHRLPSALALYCSRLGFQIVRSSDLLRSATDRTSVAIRLGGAHLLLTAPTISTSPVTQFLEQHGEGVRDIALSVLDLESTLCHALDGGARCLQPINKRETIDGDLVSTAQVAGCGDVVHTLVETATDTGDHASLPGLSPPSVQDIPQSHVIGIDHVAIALGRGQLDECADLYSSCFGLIETHAETTQTAHSAMRSKVIGTSNGELRFPIMEPLSGPGRSQIEDFVLSNGGPGVQHIAFLCADILQYSAHLRDTGIEFLSTPSAYYDTLEARVGNLSAELHRLRQYGILADRDASGLLLQVFTKPIGSRPTLFLELVERRGARGFGSGNIRALYEAVERSKAQPAPPEEKTVTRTSAASHS
jgi:4-hydroxyphenylpyruvate dioxygenase